MSTVAAAIVLPFAALAALSASIVLVTRLERIASRRNLSEALLGILVALAANTPEVASAVTAYAHGQRTIGAGVVLGSNVFNLAALLGLAAIVASRIELHRRVVLLEGLPAIWIALVTLCVLVSGWSAAVGLALVLLVVVPYLVVSAGWASRIWRRWMPAVLGDWLHRAVHEAELEIAPAVRAPRGRRRDVALAVASLVVVVVSSVALETAAQQLGTRYAISGLVVGAVILAAITSLPNAVGAIYLASRGRGAAVLSEAMNSNMLNVVVGLLLPGLFLGLGATSGASILVASWYAGLTTLCVVLALRSGALRRSSGLLIIAGYAAFVVVAIHH